MCIGMKYIILFSFVIGMQLSALADKLVLLDSNRDSLQARADFIQKAQTSIDAQYFTIDKDKVSLTAMALLMDAARKNPHLQVRIIVDSMHNLMLRQTMAAVMGNISPIPSNVKIREYNQFNLFHPFRYTKRMHDKGMIIDGKYMISGGRNIANGYFGQSGSQHGENTLPVFEDSDALLLESQAISIADRYFNELWNSKFVDDVHLYDYSREALSESYCYYREEDLTSCEMHKQNRIRRIQDETARLDNLIAEYKANQLPVKYDVSDWAAKGINVKNVDFLFDEVVGQKSNLDKPLGSIGEQLYSVISKAHESVIITTPYLIITPEQETLFKILQSHNVSVTIITNSKGSNDVPAAYVGYEKTRQIALNAGVKIYEYQGPDTLHAKMVLIDRSTLFIGSFNWDFRSQNLNREVGILAELPDDSNNDLSMNVIRKFASIFSRSCELGSSVCTLPLRSSNTEELSNQEFADLSAAFAARQSNPGTIYRILFPVIKKQL